MPFIPLQTKKGFTPLQAQQAISTLTPLPLENRLLNNTTKPGFIENVKEDALERFLGAMKAGERLQKGEQTLPETVLQTGGEIAGLGSDVIGRGISALLPDVVEELLGKGFAKAIEVTKVEKLIDRYKKFAEENPREAENIEAVVKILELYVLGNIAQKGVEGAIKATKKAGEATLKVGKAGAEALGTTGQATKAAGQQIAESAFDITAKEAPLVQAYRAKNSFWDRFRAALKGEKLAGKPITTGETAFREGLMGTEAQLGVQAKVAAKNLWDELIGPELEAVKKKISMPKLFDKVESQIKKVTADAARRNDLLEALKALRDDYKGINEVSFPQLQNIKEDWARFVPEKAYRGKPIAGSFNAIKDMAADQARQAIYHQLGDAVRQAYLDYGNLKGIMLFGQKAMTEGGFRGGFGGFVSALYEKATTPIKTIGGQTVYKVGEGLEFIGKEGAKNLGELLSKL